MSEYPKEGAYPKKEKPDLVKQMGSRFKAFRQLLNLTQAEMAKELDTSQGNVFLYESGKRRIYHEHIMKLVDAYRLNPMYLFTLSNNPFLKSAAERQTGEVRGIFIETPK